MYNLDALTNPMNRTAVFLIKRAIKHGLDDRVGHLIKKYGSYLTQRNLRSLLHFMIHGIVSYKMVEYIFLISPYRHNFVPKPKLLKSAVASRNTKVVRLLLFDNRFDDGPTKNETMLRRAERLYSTDFYHELKSVCRNGDTAMLKLLIYDLNIDPSKHSNRAIHSACGWGNSNIVRLLLSDSRLDLTNDYLSVLHAACETDHAKVVRILLENEHYCRIWTNLDFDHRIAKKVCQEGYIGVLKLLMEDMRFGIFENALDLIHQAAIFGRIDVVRLFLSKDIDFSAIRSRFGKNPKPIKFSNIIEKGYVDIMRLFLEDGRFQNVIDVGRGLHTALIYERIEMVRLLIHAPNTDPSFDNNSVLCSACQKDQTEIVRVLLTDSRVVERGLDRAILYAYKRQNVELYDLLYEHAHKKIEKC